ncbi:MAG: NAD-dependent epimerase/dehydratase family protein [Bradymonadia bacterium]
MPDVTQIAVTGANGFIGSALVRAALQRGIAVRALCRNPSPDADALARAGASVVFGDLEDLDALDTLCNGADAVVHAAAFMGKKDAALSERVNVVGTENILQAATRGSVKRFVYISSISVYRGTDAPDRIFSEAVEPHLADNLNNYSRTKLVGEHRVAAYCNDHPLEYTIVRPTNVYGPGCRPWGTQVEKLVETYHVCFGRIAFNFVHIDDLVDGLLLTTSHESAANESFNLGAETLELRRFHRYIAQQQRVKTFDVPQPIDHLIRHGIDLYGRFSGEIRSTGYTQLFRYPHGKAERLLGYQPRHLIASP